MKFSTFTLIDKEIKSVLLWPMRQENLYPLILPFKFKYSAKCKLVYLLIIDLNMWMCFALDPADRLNFMAMQPKFSFFKGKATFFAIIF